MSDATKGFLWHCPQGHEVYSTFDVEQLQADLATGIVHAFCLRCGQNYAFSSDVQANLRKGSTERWTRAQNLDGHRDRGVTGRTPFRCSSSATYGSSRSKTLRFSVRHREQFPEAPIPAVGSLQRRDDHRALGAIDGLPILADEIVGELLSMRPSEERTLQPAQLRSLRHRLGRPPAGAAGAEIGASAKPASPRNAYGLRQLAHRAAPE
jgi:hypothetical protein